MKRSIKPLALACGLGMLTSLALVGQETDAAQQGSRMLPSDALSRIDEWLLPPSPQSLPAGVEMLAGPNDQIEDFIIKQMKSAQSEILFSYYAITSYPFVQNLLGLYRERKLLIAGLLEGKPNIRPYETIQYLSQNMLPILIPPSDRIHTENYIIIDRRIVISGAYYPSNKKENTQIIMFTDPGVANEFYRRWYNQANISTLPIK